ncbi:hypothetical protein [Vitiosangium sp. GDMCC 1.1324]|uniref:hypothetical protein n=1 Tax=Vitiosangium sp. (strain GDMCC 1.1324) TaxID=2138576 RepID=UPI000D36B80A|nr:hypothetical protein [Vitiosangium sp. GDMCC 1.1324]PTL83389.1 hypothetical protein DAT35_15550 [Vitiosangium sp. GDMCC 1.1324]
MPVDPEYLPVELQELAPAIQMRMPRGGDHLRRRPSDVPREVSAWVEITFDPASPMLPESVRTCLAAALGSTSVVRVLVYSERSVFANKEVALEQLKAQLGSFLSPGH